MRVQVKMEQPVSAVPQRLAFSHSTAKGLSGDGKPPQQNKPQTVRKGKKIGRNDPCWCNSGKKYKRCHYPQAAP